MTRETKIGLVVGLGFIVVFAILLSHKGTPDYVGPPSDVWPRSGELQMADANSAIGQPATSGEQDSAEAPVGDAAMETTSTEHMQPGDVLPEAASHESGIQPPVVASDPAPDAAPAVPEHPEVVPAVTPSRVAPVTAEPRMPAAAPEKTKKSPAPRLRPEDALPEPARPVPPTEHLAKKETGRKHEVKEGDTLYRLARLYYNTPAKKVIDGIYNANRDQLSNRHDLKLGQILTIPMNLFEPVADPLGRAAPPRPHGGDATKAQDKGRTRGASRAPGPAGPALATKAKTTGKSAAPGGAAGNWKWYAVKPKDTFYSIARQVLGTSTRWRELQSLNKSIVSDPHKLRPGEKIKIPVGRPPGVETAGLEPPRQ